MEFIGLFKNNLVISNRIKIKRYRKIENENVDKEVLVK